MGCILTRMSHWLTEKSMIQYWENSIIVSGFDTIFSLGLLKWHDNPPSVHCWIPTPLGHTKERTATTNIRLISKTNVWVEDEERYLSHKYYHSVLFKKNFLVFIYFWERQRHNVSGVGAEREGGTKPEAGSRLRAFSMEPDAGLEPTNREIMTWAEVGRSTDWATQVPLCFFISKNKCIFAFQINK